MAIITNYLLFNHTYLHRLQADSSVDEQASLAAQGVRDWHAFRDDGSIQSMVDSWVGPLLNSLELELEPLEPDDSRVHLLYTAWDQTTPVGLCYVTPPGADLDTTTKSKHWMAQAVLAARNWKTAPGPSVESQSEDQEDHTLRWVILTNGNQWRLLDANALRRYEAYLQVDLGELARDPGDLSALRVFYRCFQRSAFERDSEGESGLDRLLDESKHATEEAEDHLKDCVSANEGVMAQLCLGLVESTGKDRFTEEERDAIYRDATYLLYRMLFILYAEARDLLPMHNPAYRQRSLTRLVETAHKYKLHGIPDHSATGLWEQLKQLCNAIYESDEMLDIPAYNGGLFDAADKPYLRSGAIADEHLTQALFDLAYQPDGDVDDGYRRIDYRDLSVRHLGSIYEGMIEYKLQIAEETLWARRDGKGNIQFLKTGQDGAPRRNDVEIEKGDVYFSQSPGERRATGTYYTPGFVVDYIVRQTVVRGLRERRASLEEKLATWLEEVGAAIYPSEERRMQRTANEELLHFVEEEVLTFRVCDPAMGSGHFLVNAAHQITAFIVETLHLTAWGGNVVDSDPVGWRRRVVERCLYGVDISLMAVELAKLSLWLASVAEDEPFSFLDHHLRRGNSLIGTRLGDLAQVLPGVARAGPSRRERRAREAGQLSMLEHPAFREHVVAATSLLARISARVTETVEDIRAQEADYEKVQTELGPYQRLASLLVARYFGVDVEGPELRAIGQYLINGAVSPVPQYEELVDEVRVLASQRHFLHWELEFPEVLLDGQTHFSESTPGFDVVLGNPPWGASLDSATAAYIGDHYQSAKGNNDTYTAFFENSVTLLKLSGRVGMIMPDAWTTGASYQPMREKLLASCIVNGLVDLPYDVFESAYVDCMILIAKRFRNPKPHKAAIVSIQPHEKPEAVLRDLDRIERVSTKYWLEDKTTSIPMNWRESHYELSSKIVQQSQEMGNLVELASGVTAYGASGHPSSKGRIFHSRHKKSDDWIPYFTGSCRRYRIKHGVEQYLHYGDHLVSYPDLRFFQGERLQIRRMISRQFRMQASLTDEHYAIDDSSYFGLPRDSKYDLAYILSIFNSRLLSWFQVTSSAIALRDDYPKLTLTETRSLPIRSIPLPESPNLRDALAEEAHRLYDRCVSQEEYQCSLRAVEQRLARERRQGSFMHYFLAHMARQMVQLHKERQGLGQKVSLFRFVEREIPCVPLDKALGGPLAAGQIVREIADLSAVHHDIEALRLSQEERGYWLLEVRVKLRDPQADWREHQRDADGNFIRRWRPVCRLPLDQDTGCFYHYAFANLDGFDGAGKFPGGFTRTTLKKLQLTKVPKFVPVDLEPLAALEAELTEVRRKIHLTDDLIDQIVYKLYGLTEEEIAIVEGCT
jgi:hypothetical protein